ncbi:MAG: hypothetical protein COB22_08920 [Cycloclasticus sp.]|nr:MAG: hypothetical protein COB22_08920 [Cycloclasticus sp.]
MIYLELDVVGVLVGFVIIWFGVSLSLDFDWVSLNFVVDFVEEFGSFLGDLIGGFVIVRGRVEGFGGWAWVI